jgi:hypothetical protein
LPSQQAIANLNDKLSAGLPEIQSTIQKTIITTFGPPPDAQDREKHINIITNVVNQAILIGTPLIVSGINAIIKPNGNASSPDQAICDLKNVLNGNLACIQESILNEANECNIQKVIVYMITNNILPC